MRGQTLLVIGLAGAMFVLGVVVQLLTTRKRKKAAANAADAAAPGHAGPLAQSDRRRYGGMKIAFFTRA